MARKHDKLVARLDAVEAELLGDDNHLLTAADYDRLASEANAVYRTTDEMETAMEAADRYTRAVRLYDHAVQCKEDYCGEGAK